MSNVSSNMCLAHLLECLWCVHNRLDCPHTAVLWWSTRMTSKSSPSPNSAVGTRASPFSHCWHSRYASDYGICLSWLCCVFWGRKWWAPMHPPQHTQHTQHTDTMLVFFWCAQRTASPRSRFLRRIDDVTKHTVHFTAAHFDFYFIFDFSSSESFSFDFRLFVWTKN